MSTVIYVAIVEGDQDRGYSAFFPDLPGCVSASDTMLELPAEARDALTLHLAGMAEDGQAFPEPTPLELIKADPEVREVGRLLVDAEIEDTPVRVNISIGAQFLRRVDVAAEARGMSRSAFLIESARAAMAKERVADLSLQSAAPVSPVDSRELGRVIDLMESLHARLASRIEQDGGLLDLNAGRGAELFSMGHLRDGLYCPTAASSAALAAASSGFWASRPRQGWSLFKRSAPEQQAFRYLLVPCGDELTAIWDRIEEQVVDVISDGTTSAHAKHRGSDRPVPDDAMVAEVRRLLAEKRAQRDAGNELAAARTG